MASNVPTLYEWLGGAEPLRALISRFYEKVPADPVLAPLFARMPAEHFQHVAEFIGEVLGGPADYSAHHGGHANMIRHHLGKGITDEQCLRSDPEFRSALVAYLEWGSRLAVINSALPSDAPVGDAPMPAWNWGVPGGPYQPDPSDSNA